jgi:lysophospholipase L1-like esterase
VKPLFLIILAIAGVCALRRQAPAPAYLALGDSYTIGESVAENERYPVQALHRLFPDGQPEIIATTGWTTGNLLAALDRARSTSGYQAVSLLIGVNNQYQGRSQAEYREQLTTLLQEAIRLAGNRPDHVLVLSIPDYSVTPFARNRDVAHIAMQIDSFNAINSQLAVDYKVNYLDVTAESRKAADDPSLVATDGLHFSGKEYAIWAKMMEPWLTTALAQR